MEADREAVPDTGATRFRVLVAEDHPLMLEAIVDHLERAGDMVVVGAVCDGDQLVEAYQQLLPDVVITDLSMPGTDGVAATAAIRNVDPTARVLILSAFDDQTKLASAIEAGAVGYILKSLPADELRAKVRAAAEGEPVFDASATRLLLAEVRDPTRKGARGANGVLSQREAEILALVSEGMSNVEVAERLYISHQTVKTHMERIFSKLGVRGRAAAVREGMERGLLG